MKKNRPETFETTSSKNKEYKKLNDEERNLIAYVSSKCFVLFFFSAAAVISGAGPFPSMWWTAKRPAAGRWISMEKEKSGPLRRAAPYAYAVAI